ncbi:MAG: PEP-CTERM sorting domain-containing protein [Moorea sp. SIO2B7]|nr:PEP-CTERM sorting domain-containing protein [Moorena sp. SIO2B7]
MAVGVYDVAGSDKTSALLVDNFRKEPKVVQDVPEPSSLLSFGFLIAGGICTAMKKKVASAKKKSEDSDS